MQKFKLLLCVLISFGISSFQMCLAHATEGFQEKPISVFDEQKPKSVAKIFLQPVLDRVLRFRTSGGSAVLIRDGVFLTVGHALVSAEHYIESENKTGGAEILSRRETALQLAGNYERSIEGKSYVLYAPVRKSYEEIKNTVVQDDFLLGVIEPKDQLTMTPLKIVKPIQGQTVIGVGFPVDFKTRQQSPYPFYTVGKILSHRAVRAESKNWTQPYDPSVEFVFAAKSTNGMSGGPIFNSKRQLVGIIARTGVFASGIPYTRAFRADIALARANQRLSAFSSCNNVLLK